MKRNVLWVASLVTWFLLCSTFLSLRVEQLMVPFVTECTPTVPQDSTTGRLELDCLFPDEQGQPVLYQTYEGLGWDSGLRVKLANPAGYIVEEDDIAAGALDRVIQYASKEFTLGERVEILETEKNREDLYLATCPSGVRLRNDLSPGVTVLGQTDNSVLVDTKQAPSVFLPKQAVTELFQRQPLSLPDERVYSMTDVEKFFGTLPLIALLPGITILVFLLWATSFPMLRHVNWNRRFLLGNGGVAIVALAVFVILLYFVDLPSSLLPPRSIVDVSHYGQEFSEIFAALEAFSQLGISQAQDALSHCHTMLWISLGVILACILLAVSIVVVEKHVCSKTLRQQRS